MTGLIEFVSSTTTSTPISEAIAVPVRTAPLPTPELSSLSEPAWQASVVDQIMKVVSLKEGWDGFKAGPIRRDVIRFAVLVLEAIMRPDTPAPHITPMSHEGLMLEWHQNGIELEIEIEAPGSLWISFEDAIEGINQEQPLTTDFGMIAVSIDKLTERALGDR